VSLNDRRGKDETIAVGLDEDGQLIGLDTLALADARAVAVALRRGALEVPAEVLALVRDDGGGAQGPALTAPVGVAIRGVRPAFTWQPLEGAAGYTLVVLEESGAVALRGGPTRSTKWTPPRSLRRGATYSWSVTAQMPAEPADTAAPGAGETAGDTAEGGAGAPDAAAPRAASITSARARSGSSTRRPPPRSSAPARRLGVASRRRRLLRAGRASRRGDHRTARAGRGQPRLEPGAQPPRQRRDRPHGALTARRRRGRVLM